MKVNCKECGFLTEVNIYNIPVIEVSGVNERVYECYTCGYTHSHGYTNSKLEMMSYNIKIYKINAETEDKISSRYKPYLKEIKKYNKEYSKLQAKMNKLVHRG